MTTVKNKTKMRDNNVPAPAQFHTNEILRIVNEIRHSKVPNKLVYFSKQYPAFRMAMPVLFEKACDDTFPLKYFELMLSQRDNMFFKDAETIVHNALNEEYLNPVLSNIPPNEATNVSITET